MAAVPSGILCTFASEKPVLASTDSHKAEPPARNYSWLTISFTYSVNCNLPSPLASKNTIKCLEHISLTFTTPLSLNTVNTKEGLLPHKVLDVSGSDVPLAAPIQSLERSIRFKQTKFAKLLSCFFKSFF